jgi:flagellar biosynthesis anti-sigma factor FlgM
MTTRIDSYSEGQALTDPFTSPGASPAASLPAVSSATSATGAATAPSTEAVTLTPEAQTSTDLLEAARAASGVDHQAVQSLKADISSGTYQVPPESLATTIVAALAELRS